jgi:hypothetical protein
MRQPATERSEQLLAASNDAYGLNFGLPRTFRGCASCDMPTSANPKAARHRWHPLTVFRVKYCLPTSRPEGQIVS